MPARVLHVIQSLNPAHGGTTEAARLLSRPMPGFVFETACADSPGSPWGESWGNRLWQTGPSHTRFGFSIHSRPLMRELIPSMSLVVIHGMWLHLGLIAAAEARSAGVPYMIFPHGMLDPWALRQSRLKKTLALVSGYQAVLDHATAVGFTTSEEMRLAMPVIKNSRGMRVVIPLGSEGPPLSSVELKSRFARNHPHLFGRSIWLFLGRLHPKKGCDLLITAFARWKQSVPAQSSNSPHLRLAGPCASEAYLGSLLTLCARHRLQVGEDVSFPGLIDQNAKWEELSAADCLVLPSHQENFGIVVAEALACGLPVLLSDQVNTAASVVSHKAGLVSPATVDGTLASLTSWSLLTSEEKSQLRVNALRLFEKEFSAKHARDVFAREIRPLIRHHTPSEDKSA